MVSNLIALAALLVNGTMTQSLPPFLIHPKLVSQPSKLIFLTLSAKRAYIVILGFCAFSLATIYILEYLSRYPVEGSDFIGVYIAQIVGCISIMLIGATPGGGAYRRSPSHNFFVDGIHALAAMAGLMILSGCNYYNASKAPGTPFNIFVIVGSSVALLLFVVFALIAAVNLKIFGSSGSKGDHYSAMDRPDDAEDGGILYQLSYLTQMLCYNITIVVSILASWHRNLDMCWSQLN